MLPALKESSQPIPLFRSLASFIEIRALTKSYGKGGAPEVKVLESLDLNVAQGEFLAVMGPSGSGKSTLLNIMGGIDRQTSGTVAVEGLALETMAESALTTWRSRTVGFVFQRHYLIPILTASENVELPLTLLPMTRRERRRRVAAALSLVGLSDRSKHKPSQLSGGQEQRVGIARAFVTDPHILLCDEPTGDLDRKTSDDILDLLVALKEEFGKTIILVTHDDHAAARADRLLRMSAGRLLKA